MVVATAEKISIHSLKAMIGGLESGRLRDRLASSSFAGGVPRGAISEITGAKRTEWVVRLLAENPGINVAWVEANLSVLPAAIAQRGGGLERILFVEAERHLDWTIRTLLRSGLFPALIATGDLRDERRLRRYQIFAEQANTSLVLISERPSSAWSIALQVEAGSEIRLLKRKG